MKPSLQNDYHNGSQNRNPPHTTADLKQKSSCLHLESETPLSFYYGLHQINTSRRQVSTSVSGRSSTWRRSRELDLPLLQPTRMETLKVLFRKLGHSEGAAQLMITLRPSSIH